MKHRFLYIIYMFLFYNINYAMNDFKKDLQNIYQGIHVCNALSISCIPLESRIESASNQIVAYLIAAKKVHTWVPIEWHKKIVQYIYLLRIHDNAQTLPFVNVRLKANNIDYTFVNPTIYLVSNDIKCVIQKNSIQENELRKKYSCTGIYWKSNNFFCFCNESSFAFSSYSCIKEDDIIDVQYDANSNIFWTHKDGTKLSMVDNLTIREGNHIKEPIIQDNNRFCKKSYKDITYIWDTKMKKNVGNVQYKFGFLQELDVLFCSPENGLILHCPLLNLLYVSDTKMLY